jgi:hypothetical protein
MARAKPEPDKEQDRPQQARQKTADPKQPVPGGYDDELETEEGAPEAEPARPK